MELKIGVLTLQSKALPKMSKSYMNGLRLGLSKGSIDAKFIIEGAGDGTDVNAAVEKMEKLVMQEEVSVIVGLLGHRSAAQVHSTAQDLWVPTIMSDYGANLPIGLTKTEAFFSNSLDRWHSTYLLGKHLAQNTSGEVGVAASYYDCGYGLVEGLERGLYKAGGNFIGHYIVPHQPRENEADFFKEAVSGMGENPLFAVHSGIFGLEFGESLEALGNERNFPIYTTNETVSAEVLEKYGEYYEGATVVTSWAVELDTPENQDFVELFNAKYKNNPDNFSLLGYETGLAIVAALDKIEEGALDEDSLIAELAKVNIKGPRGKVAFNNDVQHNLNNHHMLQVCKTEEGFGLRPIGTLETDVAYFKEVCHEEDTGKRGGWFNAYLCH